MPYFLHLFVSWSDIGEKKKTLSKSNEIKRLPNQIKLNVLFVFEHIVKQSFSTIDR